MFKGREPLRQEAAAGLEAMIDSGGGAAPSNTVEAGTTQPAVQPPPPDPNNGSQNVSNEPIVAASPGAPLSIQGAEGEAPDSSTPEQSPQQVIPTEPVVPPPVATPVEPEAQPTQEPQPTPNTDSIIAFLENQHPDFIKNPNVSNMGKIIDDKAREVKDLQQQLKDARVEQKKEPTQQGRDDISLILAEKKKLEDQIKELEPFRAKVEVEKNQAFQEKYDAPRAEAMENILRIGKQAGIDEQILHGLMNQPYELAAVEYLNEHVENGAARELLQTQAFKFVKLSQNRQDAINEISEDPVKKLQEWQDVSRKQKGQQAMMAAQQAQYDFGSELESYRTELTDPTSGDPLFQTKFGDMIFSEAQELLQAGLLDEKTLARSVVKAGGYNTLSKAVVAYQGKVASLEKELALLRGGSANAFTPSTGAGVSAQSRLTEAPVLASTPEPLQIRK